jgi:peptidoglycan/xylan/chitin deacetylase (PgdA/CDA1 family)
MSQKAIYNATGVHTKLLRTPNGDFDKRVLSCLSGMGYTVIQWNTDSLDWKNPGVKAITQRVLNRAVPGDIILMHASDSSRQIEQALPQIIVGLRAKGYHFVTVSELLSQGKVTSQVQ